ncbi:MAG: PilC/PilY family type IV pilus protein [Pseudomonadota bacterium]|nr:PilC/PilY family type IV pilus protein [Pseudomonadota bacterium]
MNRAPLALLLLLGAPSWAASTGTDELLSTIERVPPVVVFVVDLSSDMSAPCDGSGVGDSCLQDTLDAIQQVARHWDTAAYGVVGTSSDPTDDAYFPIVPVGSSYAEIATALAAVTVHGGTTRNLAEVVESLSETYLQNTAYDDEEDDDGDGYTGDWGETPIGYSCSETHIIVLAKDRPVDDEQVDFAYAAASNGTAGEVACDAAGITSPDLECTYDNVAAHLYNLDLSLLADTQRAIVHTISLGVTAGSIAEDLFNNASTNTVGEGLYTDGTSQGEILSGILSIMSEIAAGTYTRSTPVVTADGAFLIYTFYEVTGENPLAQGHVRAYELDDDPASSTYGEVMYDGPSAYGGAVWDGGDLLVSRPITSGESNRDDNDGVGVRDIYTYEDYAYLVSALGSEADSDRRIGFDLEFAQAVGGSAATLGMYFDTSLDAANLPCGADPAYDLNDDCLVDVDDLQSLIDFVRGLPEAEFRYLDMERGAWKLGDSPYSIPVVVTSRNDNFSTDATYREFLATLEANEVPGIVLLAANDGMLHAFRLEDDPATATEDEAGEELWAWVPGYLLMRDKDEEWANSLIDLMWSGKSFLFDGSPVVEDVWIDDGDGMKSADEWHRVVVVQQGMGGPVTLALDITDTQFPTFLWEQVNSEDTTAQGYGTGRPVIFNVYDARFPTGPDQWVAMWGGGRAPGYTGDSGNNYWESSEANLYMWNMGDDAWASESVGYDPGGDNIGARFPDSVPMGGAETPGDLGSHDADTNVEHGYISAALAAVDVDGDGDGDVLYFPVTSTYRPTDEGGAGLTDPQDPGSSWMYKAIVSTTQPDDLEWCEFYDPMTGTDGTNGVGARPEVYYAATTAWLTDGSLGIYWGSGTPFDRDTSSTGYFFAMYDENPLSCASVAQPIPCNGNDGYYPLDGGEGLTSDPLVYAGVVYFTTYTADADRCELGTGRVYGLQFDDCAPGMDTDGSDGVTPSDSPYIETEGIVSGLTAGDGTIYYGTADPTTDGSSSAVETIRAATDPFLGTTAIAWMEIY